MRSRTVMRLSQKRERGVAGERGSVRSVVGQTCSLSQSPGVVVTVLIAAIKYLLKHVKEGKGLTLGHSWSTGHCAGMLRGRRLSVWSRCTHAQEAETGKVHAQLASCFFSPGLIPWNGAVILRASLPNAV